MQDEGQSCVEGGTCFATASKVRGCQVQERVLCPIHEDCRKMPSLFEFHSFHSPSENTFFFLWWAEQGSFLQDSLNSWCYSQLIKQLTVKFKLPVQIHMEQPLCNLQKKQSRNKNQNFSASWSASLCVADSSTGRVTLLAFPTEPLGSDLPSARRVEATDPPTATCRWMPRAFSWKVALNPL